MDPVLQKIVDGARELAGARFAALGVPDPEGGFAKFITSGMSQALMDAIGPLPKTHGLLGRLFTDPAPFRIVNIETDPHFIGYPEHHPHMKSFLGVPIVHTGHIIGALFLSEKLGEDAFTVEEETLIVRLASRAAVAIENAHLHEASRELSVVEERNRLARDLHDSVSQTLFSAALSAQAAMTLIENDSAQAREQITRVQELTRDALKEMRSLIFELRPVKVEEQGLVSAVVTHVSVLKRIHDIDFFCDTREVQRPPVRIERELFRIVQESLNNIIKHSAAKNVTIRIEAGEERVRMEISDDGVGFVPDSLQIRTRHLGLTSMEERAQSLGGTLVISSSPGAGTTVQVEVPVG